MKSNSKKTPKKTAPLTLPSPASDFAKATPDKRGEEKIKKERNSDFFTPLRMTTNTKFEPITPWDRSKIHGFVNKKPPSDQDFTVAPLLRALYNLPIPMKPTRHQALTPLKILVFSSKGGGTGCALRARYIAEAFRKRGHQAVLVKPIPSLPLWFDMVLSLPYYLFKSFGRHSDVAMAIKPYPTVIPALWWQRIRGAKVVIDVDDLDFDYSHGAFRKFHQWLQKPWPKWADLVTYHTPHLLAPLHQVFHVSDSKLVQLPQGVDTNLFSPKPGAKENLPGIGAALARDPKARPLLVFTAHLNVACDLEPVLKSFQIILKTAPQANLLVAGGGPDEGRFKRLALEMHIAPSVHFTGYLSPRQVAACLNIADAALVYYSDTAVNRHRASMKLREAVASGCRVVATQVGEISQWKAALFLSKPDPIHFSQAILKVLKSKKSPRGGPLLVKKWDWTNCVEPLEKELLKS